MDRSKFRSKDQKLDKQIKSWINKLNVGLTDRILDQQIKCQINRSKVRSTYQEMDQQIKSQTNRLTEQKLDEQV